MRNLKGLVGSVSSALGGVFHAMKETNAKGAQPSLLRKISALFVEITEVGLGTVAAAYSGSAASIMNTTLSWINLAVSLVAGKLPAAYGAAGDISRFTTGLFKFFIYTGDDGSGVEIARGIVGTIPALVVPAKYIKGPGEVIPTLADLMCGFAVAAIELGITFAKWNNTEEEIPTPRRLSHNYLPFVSNREGTFVQMLPQVANGQ